MKIPFKSFIPVTVFTVIIFLLTLFYTINEEDIQEYVFHDLADRLGFNLKVSGITIGLFEGLTLNEVILSRSGNECLKARKVNIRQDKDTYLLDVADVDLNVTEEIVELLRKREKSTEKPSTLSVAVSVDNINTTMLVPVVSSSEISFSVEDMELLFSPSSFKVSSRILWKGSSLQLNAGGIPGDSIRIKFSSNQIVIDNLKQINEISRILTENNIRVEGTSAFSGYVDIVDGKIDDYEVYADVSNSVVSIGNKIEDITVVRGGIVARNGVLEIVHSSLLYKGGEYKAAVKYRNEHDWEVLANFQSVRFDKEFIKLLPLVVKKALGRFELDVYCSGSLKVVQDESIEVSISASISDGTAMYKKVPIAVGSLTGFLEVNVKNRDYSVNVHFLEGTSLTEGATSANRVVISARISNGRVEVNLSLRNFEINSFICESCPEGLRRLLLDLEISGLGNFDCNITGREERLSFTVFSRLGSLSVRKIFVENSRGLLWIRGLIGEDGGVLVSGAANLDFARLKGYDLREVSCYFEYRGDQRKLIINDINATGYQGRVNSLVVYDFENNEIVFSGDVYGLDVGNFLRSAKGVSSKMLNARLDLSLATLKYNLGSQNYSGNGSVKLKNVDFGEIPNVARILSAIFSVDIMAPDISFYDSGTMIFHFKEGNKIFFKPFILNNESLMLYGYGWVDLDGHIELKVTDERKRFGGLLSFLSPLDFVLNNIQKAVRGFSISGTLDNPRVILKAFPPLHQDPAWLD